MTRPRALDESPIEHRRDVCVELEISVSSEPSEPSVVDVDGPGYCVRVPKTKSVKGLGSHDERFVLDLKLEVRSATTRRLLEYVCRACTPNDSPPSAPPSIVDFSSPENLIKVKRSKALVRFRLPCLSGHHGDTDGEYQCADVTSSKSIAYVPAD